MHGSQYWIQGFVNKELKKYGCQCRPAIKKLWPQELWLKKVQFAFAVTDNY